MPTWGAVLKQFEDSARARHPQGPDGDRIRKEFLQALHQTSGRAVISYMSGWLEGGRNNVSFSVEGGDVHGLMEVCYKVDEKELDLILHSPGGSPQAAEQMLEYLRTQFRHIRAIIPLQAKSAATMIALGCDEILMGAHSELGPIDPQILVPVPEGQRFAPAHAILRDFDRAKGECADNVENLAAWTPILRSYAGGLIEFCHQQVQLSMEIVEKWLERWMLRHPDLNLSNDDTRKEKAKKIAEWFGSEDAYDHFRTHSRPIRYEALKEQGLPVKRLEDDDALQDQVLSIYHANSISLQGPPVKIIENHRGRRKVMLQQLLAVKAP